MNRTKRRKLAELAKIHWKIAKLCREAIDADAVLPKEMMWALLSMVGFLAIEHEEEERINGQVLQMLSQVKELKAWKEEQRRLH